MNLRAGAKLRSMMATIAALGALLGGCAATPDVGLTGMEIPPLIVEGQSYSVENALSAPDVKLLETSDEMRAFVHASTQGLHNQRRRLQALHKAVKEDAGLDMRYDPFADGDAQQVFERRTANCLSYAHMFIALAREAGLEAHYQWMEVRPEWQRIGERVAVRLHVNVEIRDRDGQRFMVDIDPLQRSEVAGARVMSDAEGLALHHNNLAMMALSEDRIVDAWESVLRGLDAAPGLSQLWVNLGAIYRATGQNDEAEESYHRALEVNSFDRSAMNNLVVLYGDLGEEADAAYWTRRLHRYRDRNPYYHASLGDHALQSDDWEGAYKHYVKARKLQPEDGQLSYALGVIEQQRGNLKSAERLLTHAVDKAAFPLERERYLVRLASIREEQEQAAL
ncbi:MAG: tetratricopeptide repeat protein [Pseudomonadota bacterium]